MPEALSYKDLEKLVKDLSAEKRELEKLSELKENTLKSKENLYNQIFNHTNEGVMVIQGETIKFINKSILQILDASRADLEKMNFSEIIHPDHRGDIIQYISQIVSGEQIKIETETEIITHTGKIIPVRVIFKKLLVALNQVSVLVQLENIQEFKSKEQELQNLQKSIEVSERYLEEGFVVLSKSKSEAANLFELNVLEANNAACKIMGIERNKVLGNPMGDYLIPAADIPLSDDNDDFFNHEYEVCITNLKRHFRINIYPISDLKIACKLVDISNYFTTKEELNKSLQRNELLSEILNIFNSEQEFHQKYIEVLKRIGYHFKTRRILVFTHNDRNKTAELSYQHSIKNVPLLPDEFSMPYNKVPSWNKTLLEKKMILGFSASYLSEDLKEFLGQIKISNAYVFPIFVEDNLFGSVLFENTSDSTWDNTEINFFKMIVVLISNLTARDNYESRLLKAKEKAEEADRLKSSFLANMSHDIRIPMTAIIGFSDLLADPDLTIGEREEFIELINNSGQDLLTLIDNIVDVAKIETGQLRIQKDKYLIYHLLREIHSGHLKNSKLNNQDDLELILDIPEQYKKLPFETDIFRFKQVLNNLIDNAIKFTDKGSIHIGISNILPDTIEFYVQDTGIGIAENTQEIIFERFSKIDRSYTKEYNGTGLGLAICKSLAELLGGDIRIVSYPGKGSTFYFTHPLPQEANDLITAGNNAKKPSIYNWDDKTILIAEDVEQNYKFLEYIITSSKANIVWAKNGKEALDYFKEKNPCDLVLMDIRMPVLNGLDATKEILKIRDIPIIAQTAYTLGDEKDLAMDAGCIDYISKPVHADVLLKTIQKYINQEME